METRDLINLISSTPYPYFKPVKVWQWNTGGFCYFGANNETWGLGVNASTTYAVAGFNVKWKTPVQIEAQIAVHKVAVKKSLLKRILPFIK